MSVVNLLPSLLLERELHEAAGEDLKYKLQLVRVWTVQPPCLHLNPLRPGHDHCFHLRDGEEAIPYLVGLFEDYIRPRKCNA